MKNCTCSLENDEVNIKFKVQVFVNNDFLKIYVFTQNFHS